METLLDIRSVESIVGYKKSSIYRFMKDDAFPAPVSRRGKNLWRQSDIDDYTQQVIKYGSWSPQREAA